VTDKNVRLTGLQLDRMLVLARRKLQLQKQKLRQLGYTTAEITAATEKAHDITPLAEGGSIEMGGERYGLIDSDDDGVNLRKVDPGK
jgi:hypothetical protein